MSTVSDWLAKQTAYTYDDAGRLTKTQYPNTVWTDYTYDGADRLTSVVNTKTRPVTISSFSYTLDFVGNRTQMADLSGTYSYQYDALYRLTQATYPGPQTDVYQYDADGNRASKNSTSYTYDAADQMTTAGSTNYGYDNNGNQTARGSDTFGYDHENRLTQSVIGGTTSSSVYDGDGLRMNHTVSGNTTNYSWDVAASLPVVLKDGTNTYVYGLDLISATDNSGVQAYFLYDGLGSSAGLTDGNGNNPVVYSYDAFGDIRTQTGTSANYWLFTGEQRDSDSSLYYLRARYYDPSIGRFLSEDPIPGGNLFTYAGNGPVNQVDRSGLCFGLGDCGPIDDVDNIANDVVDGAVDIGCSSAQTMVGCGLVGLGPLGDSYYDLNGTACWTIVCGTIGLQYEWAGGPHLHYYYGGGTGWGYSANFTVGPRQSITPGWNCGGAVGIGGPLGFAVQVGRAGWHSLLDIVKSNKEGEIFHEYGVTISSAISGSVTCYHVSGDVLGWLH